MWVLRMFSVYFKVIFVIKLSINNKKYYLFNIIKNHNAMSYSVERKYLLNLEIFNINTFFILFKASVTFKICSGFC